MIDVLIAAETMKTKLQSLAYTDMSKVRPARGVSEENREVVKRGPMMRAR